MKVNKIAKRNGEIVKFDSNKIRKAIIKAMKSCGKVEPKIANRVAKDTELYFATEKILPTIFDIESHVYYSLNKFNRVEVAKEYEGYRRVQSYKRVVNTTDKSIMGILGGTNLEVLKENSNKSTDQASTQRDLIAGEISKDICKRLIIPKQFITAHDNGILHYHDMDYALQSMFNCCLINLEDMFANGTVINGKLVETPKSFGTACTVATQIMAQVASNQYGGQSITVAHLAPYLRVSYDKYLAKYKARFDIETAIQMAEERKQEELTAGIQTIRYQLSTLQTTNGQAPFASIYLEIEEGSEYEKEQAEIVKEMIEQRLEGMKNEKGQIIGEAFPKLIYLLDEHNCLEGGKYDYITKLSAECTAKRLVPDYQSAKMMRKNYEGQTFPPMGCRSHLSPWKDENGKHKWYGRFNQGVVSLNIPQIGIVANGDRELFRELLRQRLELCKDALMFRHSQLLGTTTHVSPIHWEHGAIARLHKGETIDKLLTSGYSTLSLGYVGIYECVQSMLGTTHTSPEGEKFALEIMKTMEDAVNTWKNETGLSFALYGTPAENLVYRFCTIDREKFGIIPNVTDKMYYTNSYHVNVREEIDAFSKLKFESQFHDISLGGCISYVEVPDLSRNLPAVEKLINFIYHNVQYAEINSKPDVCYSCDFTGEIKLNKDLEWVCPSCGNKDEKLMQVMRRTCGYIGTDFFNKGKTQEIAERVMHL